MLEEGFRAVSWGSERGLAQRRGWSSGLEPESPAPHSHVTIRLRVRAVGAPRSASQQTRRRICRLAMERDIPWEHRAPAHTNLGDSPADSVV